MEPEERRERENSVLAVTSRYCILVYHTEHRLHNPIVSLTNGLCRVVTHCMTDVTECSDVVIGGLTYRGDMLIEGEIGVQGGTE